MFSLWPLLVLMVRFVPWIFSTVPRILTGGLAGAWATATADTAAISNAARVRIMGSPSRWTYSIYTAVQRKILRGFRNDTPSRTGFGSRSDGLPCRDRLDRRGRLPDAHGEMDRALSARRVDRCSGPDHVAMVLGKNGAVVRHREQGGRRQQYRRRARREGGPRRLHHASRQSRERDQHDALQEPAVQFPHRYRAGRGAGEGAERDGGQQFLSGQDRA